MRYGAAGQTGDTWADFHRRGAYDQQVADTDGTVTLPDRCWTERLGSPGE